MKIIDFRKNGNVVRFILGKDDLPDWYGDDWNDAPYEHNAGEVYEEYVSGYRDVAFPMNYAVLEPQDGAYGRNSTYCKDDMKDRKIPCVIAIPIKKGDDAWNYEVYSEWAGAANAIRFYMGDPMAPSGRLEVWNDGNPS